MPKKTFQLQIDLQQLQQMFNQRNYDVLNLFTDLDDVFELTHQETGLPVLLKMVYEGRFESTKQLYEKTSLFQEQHKPFVSYLEEEQTKIDHAILTTIVPKKFAKDHKTALQLIAERGLIEYLPLLSHLLEDSEERRLELAQVAAENHQVDFIKALYPDIANHIDDKTVQVLTNVDLLKTIEAKLNLGAFLILLRTRKDEIEETAKTKRFGQGFNNPYAELTIQLAANKYLNEFQTFSQILLPILEPFKDLGMPQSAQYLNLLKFVSKHELISKDMSNPYRKKINELILSSAKDANLEGIKAFLPEELASQISPETLNNIKNGSVNDSAQQGDVIALKILLSMGFSLDNNYYRRLNRPLHLAAEAGHVEFVKELIKQGIDINYTSPLIKGRTALHCAVNAGQAEVVKVLLEANPVIMITDDKDKTPLDLAKETHQSEIIALLENHIKKESMVQLFHCAVLNEDIETIRGLINEGYIDEQCKHIVLLDSIEKGSVEVVKLLLPHDLSSFIDEQSCHALKLKQKNLNEAILWSCKNKSINSIKLLGALDKEQVKSVVKESNDLFLNTVFEDYKREEKQTMKGLLSKLLQLEAKPSSFTLCQAISKLCLVEKLFKEAEKYTPVDQLLIETLIVACTFSSFSSLVVDRLMNRMTNLDQLNEFIDRFNEFPSDVSIAEKKRSAILEKMLEHFIRLSSNKTTDLEKQSENKFGFFGSSSERAENTLILGAANALKDAITSHSIDGRHLETINQLPILAKIRTLLEKTHQLNFDELAKGPEVQAM